MREKKKLYGFCESPEMKAIIQFTIKVFLLLTRVVYILIFPQRKLTEPEKSGI